MPEKKKQPSAEKDRQGSDDADRKQDDVDKRDESEVEGHVSQADAWGRATNNWKRRR